MNSYAELLGFITGVTGIWLTMQQRVWCFPVGLINVSISLYLFYHQQLYADALQQVMYIVLLIYGWIRWTAPAKVKGVEKVSRINKSELFSYAISIAGITILLGSLLSKYTMAIYPYIDSFATSTAFVAQFMIARKKIENWILWMVVNTVYIVIYFQKALFLYVVLFGIYLFLSFYGFYQWKKAMNDPETPADAYP